MGLGICSGCGRFARGDVCPFCGANGGPPVDAALDNSTSMDASPDTIMGAYGGPPMDAGDGG